MQHVKDILKCSFGLSIEYPVAVQVCLYLMFIYPLPVLHDVFILIKCRHEPVLMSHCDAVVSGSKAVTQRCTLQVLTISSFYYVLLVVLKLDDTCLQDMRHHVCPTFSYASMKSSLSASAVK